MADPIGNFVPDYIKELKDEDVREPIIRLGTMITDRAKIKLGLQKLTKEDPDITLAAEERQIGGLGIYMVKKTMDDITYEYKDGQNILRIRKQL